MSYKHKESRRHKITKSRYKVTSWPDTAVPDLLTQIPTPFKTFIGDGAYDGEPVSQAVRGREPDAKVVIPPHKTAVYSLAGDTQRDGHIQTIAQKGRIAWQRVTGYSIRNYV